jgi:hypothetical protein
MDWEKLVQFCLFWLSSKISSFSKPFLAFPSAFMPGVMREFEMLKNGIKTIEKKGLYYIVEDGGRLLKFKPWLGDAFSFLYDFIMKNSIFPKKFGGDINLHFEILSEELKDVHKKRVLELATGSGSAVIFLPNDNLYTARVSCEKPQRISGVLVLQMQSFM